MRPRCNTHDENGNDSNPQGSGPSDIGPPEPDPVLAGPAHAAGVIRVSSPPSEGPALVVLLCDVDRRVVLAVTVAGATPVAAGQIVDLVLGVAEAGGVASIVLGVVRERLGQYLPKPEVAALTGAVARCQAGGVAVLDVLVVGPRGWKSVFDDVAGGGAAGEDGR